MSRNVRLVLATRNSGKAREFGRLLGPTFRVTALAEHVPMPQETGSTFSENARLKAEAAAKALGRVVAVLADDSGLEVDALGGRPGVRSARYAGESANDQENVAKLLTEMAGMSERRARFVCSLCLIVPRELAGRAGTQMLEVQGSLEGEIALEPSGNDGFGYDPVFLPRGWSLTLGEAAPADKDRVSHRGAASRELLRRVGELGIVYSPGV